MGSSPQACPVPGSTGLLLEWAVESLKPGGSLGGRPSKQAGMKNPPRRVGDGDSTDTGLGSFFGIGTSAACLSL